MSGGLSIVVVNFNAGAGLGSCLASIRDQAPDSDLIVVDNASTDRSELAAEDVPLGARLVRNDSNTGFARAANQGLALTDSRFVLLVNPDCRLRPGRLRHSCVISMDITRARPRALAFSTRMARFKAASEAIRR